MWGTIEIVDHIDHMENPCVSSVIYIDEAKQKWAFSPELCVFDKHVVTFLSLNFPFMNHCPEVKK